MTEIDKIIAAINPSLYHDGSAKEIRDIIKNEGFSKALGKVKPSPIIEFGLVYDSPSETLEPVYFWILNFMNGMFGGKVEKLIDNFSSSPGSGHFTEMGQRRSLMQDNVMKTMGAVNQVTKSIINLIYDLKDFEIRLSHYEAAKSKDKEKSKAALLSLKQIWMDNVDIKKGNGSINGLSAGNLGFITLRDAFLSCDSIKDVEKLDLNDRVKRILIPRLDEFNSWKELSEEELKKRFNIEKNYLRSQVNTLQLYSRWVKPYLKAATQLEQSASLDKNPALVTAFSTIVLELTLMGRSKVDIQDAILSRKLPQKVKIPKRDYFSCVLVDLSFQGIPNKAGQHYVFGGKATVSFKVYTLNNEELAVFDQQLKKSEVNDIFKLIEGSTTESLDELKKDIDNFLNKEEIEKKKEEEKKSKDVNPFSALFNFSFSKKKDGKKDGKKELNIQDIKKDDYVEKLLRDLAKEDGVEKCFNIYDVYKKSHGMASHDSPFE